MLATECSRLNVFAEFVLGLVFPTITHSFLSLPKVILLSSLATEKNLKPVVQFYKTGRFVAKLETDDLANKRIRAAG